MRFKSWFWDILAYTHRSVAFPIWSHERLPYNFLPLWSQHKYSTYLFNCHVFLSNVYEIRVCINIVQYKKKKGFRIMNSIPFIWFWWTSSGIFIDMSRPTTCRWCCRYVRHLWQDQTHLRVQLWHREVSMLLHNLTESFLQFFVRWCTITVPRLMPKAVAIGILLLLL